MASYNATLQLEYLSGSTSYLWYSHKFNNLNVEISAGLGTVKYLSKYIYKGPDRATMEISDRMQDEIKAYLDGRFIGLTEACWKIFEFNMHRELPAV